MKLKIIPLLLLTLVACSKKSEVKPTEQFYFNSFKVNDQQTGGFYVSNLNLNPSFKLAFSAPLKANSVDQYIKLFEKSDINLIPLNIQMDNGDSVVVISPANKLKSISQYNLRVDGSMLSANRNKLFQNLNFGLVTGIDSSDKYPVLTDDELLNLIQQQTLKYFTDFAHPISGLARERNTSGEVCTIGGTGFGTMSLVAGTHRGFITRSSAVDQLLKMLRFLDQKVEKFHGAFPHWVNGQTGKAVPFGTYDDGGDLVETSFLIAGLLTVREYFDQNTPEETEIRNTINKLWRNVEWNWYTQGSPNTLYWHWSPNHGWKMNHAIKGWNECLITYFLGAASPTYPIPLSVYHQGWVNSPNFVNGKKFENITLPLGFDYGGPLFFAHYSFLGLDPRNLKDQYTNYWEQNTAHAKINYAYCLKNPKHYTGYSKDLWGLTASDSDRGYDAHSPTNDLGVISPTAAVSSLPYLPTEAMQAIRFMYYKLGDKLWGEYGFIDAFNLQNVWFANSYLAIDQGPMVVMIENHRSGLLWDLFMRSVEAKKGKQVLGFQ